MTPRTRLIRALAWLVVLAAAVLLAMLAALALRPTQARAATTLPHPAPTVTPAAAQVVLEPVDPDPVLVITAPDLAPTPEATTAATRAATPPPAAPASEPVAEPISYPAPPEPRVSVADYSARPTCEEPERVVGSVHTAVPYRLDEATGAWVLDPDRSWVLSDTRQPVALTPDEIAACETERGAP